MRSRILTLLLFIHCAALLVSAQNSAKRQLVLQVSNGGFVSFRSETSATDNKQLPESKSPAALLYSQALPGENRIIHRVLTDAEGRVIFGYDLWVNADPQTKKFNLAVLPSDEAFRRTFLKDSAPRKAVEGFATFPKSTAQQTLDDGDAVSLELLVNQESGVKIVDVVRVTFDRSTLHDNYLESVPKDFTLDAVALSVKSYQLLIDGKLVGKGRSSIGASGSLLWFYVPNRGRFIFSLVPRDGYSFEKLGVLDGEKIEFSVNGERYEWISALPILPNGGSWNLWVLHDPNYTPLFSSEAPMTKSPNVLEKLGQVVGAGLDKSLNKGPVTSVELRAPQRREKSQTEIPPRVMIGGADTMDNLLPKSP